MNIGYHVQESENIHDSLNFSSSTGSRVWTAPRQQLVYPTTCPPFIPIRQQTADMVQLSFEA